MFAVRGSLWYLARIANLSFVVAGILRLLNPLSSDRFDPGIDLLWHSSYLLVGVP